MVGSGAGGAGEKGTGLKMTLRLMLEAALHSLFSVQLEGGAEDCVEDGRAEDCIEDGRAEDCIEDGRAD